MEGVKKHGWENEAAMAAAVVAWLVAQGWDVYQEVEFHGGVADIVAIKDGVIWVIECKLTFSFASMEQAANWRRFCDRISLAMPDYGCVPGRWTNRVPDGWGFGWRVAEKEGLGVLLAGSYSPPRVVVRVEAVDQEMSKAHRVAFLGMLRPQHKTFAKAGSPTGKRFTPFKETCENILTYVKAHHGCTLNEMVDGVKHHYRTKNSFRSCMSKLLPRDVIPGIRWKHDATDRTTRLYPAQ